ncbi:MAG: phytanoyl-CoA dioxygenase family protein [Acidimicrobiaceae bacterium]|nr:phytanoyl-CoA dioxygenase family protein [Acidimicrobiaceae bacterium]MYA75087.1 phytanoyl-CoA dioxygenase family protein [Acidimicrobiaceae bacterium]MYD06158.1 phytanoyl-CoA dioxygenase family protein [Acidimicrobiaceae bacterium]MYG55491.1 phytanoyl-CoA dioxygenase family protein [Acidimicrobiaceae bacterium]MYI57404.1 phytanoyl-CoA dioxygenase family protein [Acidimicrobiaceae bacterium]
MAMSAAQAQSWNDRGFFIERGFYARSVVEEMIERVVELVRTIDQGAQRPDLWPTPERRLADQPEPEDRLAKLFRVMRTEEVFRSSATDPRLLSILAEMIGPDIDCFLSQFIFKHPGALGQPWHQDDFYFRMTPLPQVGVWIACTAATLKNGPLWVVPGSHTEVIHDAVRDTRPDAGLAYVEIVDADTSAEEVVLMEPGDTLFFHSRLRHRSTDNNSNDMRAAMVFHFAPPATKGLRSPNQDWVEVLRAGDAVSASTEPLPMVWS